MTSNLASVHLARGEHAEAVRWLETTISNAGEEHEEIETYQSTLEQAREQMAAASESAPCALNIQMSDESPTRRSRSHRKPKSKPTGNRW